MSLPRLCLALLVTVVSLTAAQPPNIVFIFADDQRAVQRRQRTLHIAPLRQHLRLCLRRELLLGQDKFTGLVPVMCNYRHKLSESTIGGVSPKVVPQAERAAPKRWRPASLR